MGFQKICEADLSGENSSLIFTVNYNVKSVPFIILSLPM